MKKNRLNLKTMLATISLGCMSMLTMGQISTLPVIDGDGSDAIWADAQTFYLTTVVQNPSINGTIDATASVKVLWSTDSIYFLYQVTDDSLYNGNTGDNMSLNDVAKIYLDVKNQKTSSFVDVTQQFFEIYWDGANSVRGRSGPDWATALPPINHVNVITNHVGYVSEIAMGWDQLGLSPAVGDTIGIDFAIGDNDGLGDGKQQDILSWHDQTGLVWGYPYVYGSATLEADGSLKKAEYPIKVDGSLDGSMAYLKDQNILSQTLNPQNLSPDFKGSFKGKWDTSNFYIFLNVGDKDLDSTTAAATDKYNYDNFVINLDLFNKKTAHYIDNTQMYWEIYWWNATFGGRYGVPFGPPPTPKLATQLNIGTNYTAEFVIAWADLGIPVPSVGDSMGFDLKLNNRSDAKRSELAWWDITDLGYDQPVLLGTISLGDDNNINWLSKRPNAPDSVHAEVTADTLLNLTWPAVPGAVSYNVYSAINVLKPILANVTDPAFTQVAKVSATRTYSVRAVDANNIVSNCVWTSATFTYVPPVNGIETNSIADNFKVYPIPTSDIVNIESNTENIQSVSVLNITGQVVKQYTNLNTMVAQISLGSLPKGTYFLRVTVQDGSFVKTIATK